MYTARTLVCFSVCHVSEVSSGRTVGTKVVLSSAQNSLLKSEHCSSVGNSIIQTFRPGGQSNKNISTHSSTEWQYSERKQTCQKNINMYGIKMINI